MPHVDALPPADRLFARLDRFEVECPSCGELVFTDHDTRKHPQRLNTHARRRAAASSRPFDPNIWEMVFNPVSQRLHCPFCRTNYVCGLILYPVLPGSRRPLDAPPDTVPTKRQRLEMRRAAGGWYAEKVFRPGEEVNIVVRRHCTCPKKAWVMSCAIHGHGGYVPVEQSQASAPAAPPPAGGGGDPHRGGKK